MSIYAILSIKLCGPNFPGCYTFFSKFHKIYEIVVPRGVKSHKLRFKNQKITAGTSETAVHRRNSLGLSFFLQNNGRFHQY
jgi:hypothetical protein